MVKNHGQKYLLLFSVAREIEPETNRDTKPSKPSPTKLLRSTNTSNVPSVWVPITTPGKKTVESLPGKKVNMFHNMEDIIAKTQSKSTNNRTIMANLEMNLPC